MSLSSILAEADQLNTTIGSLTQEVADIKAEVDALKASIGANPDLTQVQAKLDAISQSIADHGTALDDLKSDAAG